MTSDGHALEKGLEDYQSGDDDVVALSLMSLMIAISVMIVMKIISLKAGLGGSLSK